ncbi:hypothetical protein [Dendronalium sp. ChiSLP03b]|uniref:hypothetical protein n=1 Tax=Dendronalium sp. ChiSLP03b TaxID=3075381 RepID=UPI002AD5C73F|nr:hypothetical protein [Dendronalium sp. ChiSLP03b]
MILPQFDDRFLYLQFIEGALYAVPIKYVYEPEQRLGVSGKLAVSGRSVQNISI